MKKNLTSMLVLVAVIFLVSGFSVANAADPADVAEVVKLIYSSSRGVISEKDYTEGWRQIVFICDGKRYTLFSDREKNRQFLSVWVRPNGTSNKGFIKTFSDMDLDGQVDFGINGGNGSDQRKMLYTSKKFDLGKPAGSEFFECWQSLYDRAIIDALKTLK